MSSDDKGWISLHRKLKDHWIWDKSRTFSEVEAWIDLLMHARHDRATVRIGNILFDVGRGEQIRSLKTLAKEWNWNRSRVRRFLKLLQQDNMIVTKSETQTTRISICNYDSYQNSRNANETDVKQLRNTSETVATTKNKENNANNSNNYNKTPPEQNSKLTNPVERDEEKAPGCSVQGGIDFLCVEDLPVSDAAGIPDSVDEVLAYCREHGIKRSVGNNFYGYFKKRGWKMKTGQPVTKWQAKFKGWLKHEKNEWRAGMEDPEPKQRVRASMQAIDLTPVEMTAEEFRAQLKREA